MCITVQEANKKMEEIQSMKRLREEIDTNISALEKEVIGFLTENEETCRTTNKSGKPILQFIGNMCKATYSEQTRETVDKAEVRKMLTDEEYQKVSRVSVFSVLRIS